MFAFRFPVAVLYASFSLPLRRGGACRFEADARESCHLICRRLSLVLPAVCCPRPSSAPASPCVCGDRWLRPLPLRSVLFRCVVPLPSSVCLLGVSRCSPCARPISTLHSRTRSRTSGDRTTCSTRTAHTTHAGRCTRAQPSTMAHTRSSPRHTGPSRPHSAPLSLVQPQRTKRTPLLEGHGPPPSRRGTPHCGEPRWAAARWGDRRQTHWEQRASDARATLTGTGPNGGRRQTPATSSDTARGGRAGGRRRCAPTARRWARDLCPAPRTPLHGPSIPAAAHTKRGALLSGSHRVSSPAVCGVRRACAVRCVAECIRPSVPPPTHRPAVTHEQT